MSFTEVYETANEEFLGVVVDDEINPVRIVCINESELTPELFEQARQNFKNAPQHKSRAPIDIEWNRIERGCTLVATLTDRGGFIVHDDTTMSKHSKKMFSKKARMEYARKYNVPQAPNRRMSGL